MTRAHPLLNEVRDGRIVCTRCQEWRAPEEFSVAPRMRRGRHSWCTGCQTSSKQAAMACPDARERVNGRRRETYDAEQRRAYREANIERIRLVERRCHLMREYGMRLEEYDEMVVEQEGRCAICKQLAELLFVDHCHASGKRRKGLCESCNWGLGNFADDPVRLRAAADYVEEFQRIKDVHTA